MRLGILTACIAVIAAADLGILTGFDAVIAALAFVVLYPVTIPYILLIIASIQDAPGLSGIAWYAGIVLLGAVFVFHAYASDGPGIFKGNGNKWGVIATYVILFALMVSIANQYLGGHAQASERNPFMVAGLMIYMTWLGLIYGRSIVMGNVDSQTLSWLIALLLVHGFAVAMGQVLIDPSFMASAHGMAEIEDASQMSMETALGIPRIHGTFLSPNAFGLCMVLFLLLRVSYAERSYGKGFLLFWFMSGLFLSLVSFSKAIGIFFFLTTLFLFQRLLGWRVFLGVIALVFLIVAQLVFSEIGDDLASAFRITNELGGESYRAQVWRLVLEKFTWTDWLLGTGLAHWPVLFGKYMDVALSDPHTWLLSLPGTFGLIGLSFFLAVLGSLTLIVMRSKGNLQFVAYAILVIFAIKDMFSISYLLGNTPLTFLIWVILAVIWNKYSNMKRIS